MRRGKWIKDLDDYVGSGLCGLDRILSERDSLRLSWGIIGGGLRRGCVAEIYGDAGVGKSSLAMRFICESQRESERNGGGRCCVYVDSDCSFSMDYARRCGVDLENLCVLHGGEGVLECVSEMIKSGYVDFVVIDSVAALNVYSLDANIDGSDTDVRSSDEENWHRRCIMNWVQDVREIIEKNRCVLLLVNQACERVDYRGCGYVGTSVEGLHNLCDTRLYLSSEDDNYECEGMRVKCRVVKNRVGGVYRGCELYLRYGYGFVDVDLFKERRFVIGRRGYGYPEINDDVSMAADPDWEWIKK